MTTYHDTTGQTCTACVKVAASPICGADQSDWVCTREPGHDNVHIACGARHGAAYWVKEPTAASTAPVCCGPLDEDVAFWHARWHEAADQRDARDAAAYAWKEAARRLSIRARARWSFCDFLLSERTRADNAMIRMSARLSEAEKRAAKAEQERSATWEQLEHRDRELATAEAQRDEAQRLAAEQITEAQAEATEAVTRAETAELRAEKAEQARLRTAREHLDAAWDAAHVPADSMIPAGAEYITRNRAGGMRGPFTEGETVPDSDPTGFVSRRLLDSPTPARPEGAEDWDEELGEMPAAQDLTPEQRTRLSDALAERDHALGVRVTGAGS